MKSFQHVERIDEVRDKEDKEMVVRGCIGRLPSALHFRRLGNGAVTRDGAG
jgi:hypothetical protein